MKLKLSLGLKWIDFGSLGLEWGCCCSLNQLLIFPQFSVCKGQTKKGKRPVDFIFTLIAGYMDTVKYSIFCNFQIDSEGATYLQSSFIKKNTGVLQKYCTFHSGPPQKMEYCNK